MVKHPPPHLDGALRRFVPKRFQGPELDGSWREQIGGVEGALLVADLSDFTALTEAHSARGQAAVEQLQRALDGTFGRVIDAVNHAGGDVVCFAGDALLACWVADPTTLQAAVLQATHCGFALRGSQTDEGVTLRLRIAVCAGRLHLVEVGGLDGRSFPLIGGPVIRQVASTMAAADPGQLVCSGPAMAVMEGGVRAKPAGIGAWRVEAVLMEPGAPARRSASRSVDIGRFVPHHVRTFIASGQERWLAELRDVTALFLGLPTPQWEEAGWDSALQSWVAIAQQVVARYGGSVEKVVADDKGLTLLAAWGVPGAAPEHDADRALQAAQTLQRMLAQAGVATGVGIARGQVFCGVLGGGERAEYTLVGRAMNRAARLLAVAEGRVLCDRETHDAARESTFAAAPPVRAKGISPALEVYVPLAARRSGLHGGAPILGREAELQELDGLFARLNEGRGGTIVVLGDAGVGKSALLAAAGLAARARGIRVLEVVGIALERRSPYLAARALLTGLLGVDEHDRAAAMTAALAARIAGDPWLAERGPLLNPVLGARLSPTRFTSALGEQSRSDHIAELVVRLATGAAEHAPLAIFVDDAHWLDSASWRLVKALMTSLNPVAFVVGARPPGAHDERWLDDLRGTTTVVERALAPLAPATVDALVCRLLGVPALPLAVSAWIQARAEGNAFFSEESALALLAAGHIVKADGHLHIATADGRLHAALVPPSLGAIVTSRLDQMSAAVQVVARTASVLGRRVDGALLRATVPADLEPGEVDAALNDLVLADFLQVVPGGPHHFMFRHALAVDALYERLLLPQRQELHAAVLQAIGAPTAPDATDRAAFAAHHAVLAGAWPAAVEWLRLAGARALAQGAYAEAANQLQLALDLSAEQGVPLSPDARLQTLRQLSEACFRAGDMEGLVAVADPLSRALGLALPQSTAAWTAEAAGLLLRRALWGGSSPRVRRIGADEPGVDTLLELLGWLTDAYGYKLLLAQGLTCLQLQLHLADRRQRPAPLARAWLMAYFWAAAFPLRAYAKRWLDRAQLLAATLPDGPSKAFVCGRAGVAYLYTADWALAEASSAMGVAMARACGDKRVQTEALCVQLHVSLQQGRFDETMAAVRQLRVETRLTGDQQQGAWAELADAEVALARDDLESAEAALGRASGWLEGKGSVELASAIWARGLRAELALRQGDAPLARSCALETLKAFDKASFPIYWMLGGLKATTRTLHRLSSGGKADETATKALRDAARAVGRLARAFPYVEPVALWAKGAAADAAGRPAAARAAWLEAQAKGRQMGSSYVAAELERCLADRNPA